MVMEGVWSSHTEAALPILGSIVTRQYLRAAKAWRVHGEGRSPTCPQSLPHNKNVGESLRPSRELVKTHVFLKILKQQIMVCIISTLFQTMMRCYSSLRAGRAHILSSPAPVQQVSSLIQAWLKGIFETLDWEEREMGRVNSRKSLTEWDD